MYVFAQVLDFLVESDTLKKINYAKKNILFYAFNAIIKLFITIVYIWIITLTLIFHDYPLVGNPQFMPNILRGGFRVLARGVRDGERSELKIFGPPLWIFGPPLQGGANFYRGGQPLILKHINIGLTYDLLIVIYHLL